MYSLIIKHIRLIDGTGNEERHAEIAIENDKIVAVADKIDSAAHEIFDGKGQILAPGFIDTQNHSDGYWQLFDDPSLDSLVAQGITSILVGNCGASLAPLLSSNAILALQKWHTLDGININWQNFSEFAELMQKRKFGCNVASLIGYSTLRRGLQGDNPAALSNKELEQLKDTLASSISAGAFGLSTGLSYAHELGTSDVELYELATVLKKKRIGIIYSSEK